MRKILGFYLMLPVGLTANVLLASGAQMACGSKGFA